MKNVIDEHMRGMKCYIINKCMDIKEVFSKNPKIQSFHSYNLQYHNIQSKL